MTLYATKSCWIRSVTSPLHAFVTGDSHTGALGRGFKQLTSSGWSCPGIKMDVRGMGSGREMIYPFFKDAGTKAIILDQSYKNKIPQLPLLEQEDGRTVYCWSGLFHFAKLWRNGSWIRSRPAFMRGPGVPVSTALIKNIILHWFTYQLALIDVLRRNGVSILAIESPRPFRHHPSLRLIQPQVVAAVDGYCMGVMLGQLRQRSVDVVRIPSECLDSDGFMLPDWRHELPTDPHHANAAFGALMIRRICEKLQGELNG